MCIIGGMKSDTYQRVNISLPSTTLKRIDTIAEHGNRSRLIDTAVNFYIKQQSRKMLEEAIKEESILWRKRDRQIAEEWARLDDPWPEY